MLLRRLRLLAPSLALVCATRTAHAYRPFDGTDGGVAAHGDLELEIGPVGYLRLAHASHFAPNEVVNFGIAPRVELVLQGTEVLPPLDRASAERISLVNTAAFVKGVLREGVLQGGTGPSIALEVGPWLPTVNDEPGIGFSADGIISYQTRWWAAHLNLQGARTRSGHAEAFVGAILEGPGAWPVRPVAELFVDRELSYVTALSALVGAIVPVTEELALDLGFRLSETGDAPAAEIRAGFTLAIPVAFHHR